MRRFSTSLACVIVAGVFSGATVQAQTITTGAVTGKVTDSAGLPLSGAIVRATSGQIVRTVTTNAEGSFVVSLLNGGNWNLQITKAGYTTGSKAVQVMVNTTTPTHFKLAKEGVATVEVVATSSTIDSSSTTTGSTFALDTISSLPVGRDLANIAFLTPGVTTSGFSSTNGLNIAIAGASGAENSYSVDGLQTNDMRYGGQ